MNIRIHSAEMNRMMRIVNQCVDKLSENVEVIHDNNLLTVRGCNGVVSAVVCTPLLGGTGESFCVDGAMLTRVCAACKGEIQIETSERVCTIKGAGRTRIPIVASKVKAFEPVTGKSMMVAGADLTGCYGKVNYAISTNQARVTLTGVLMNANSGELMMTALDGFQLAIEKTTCAGDDMRILVPGSFMKMVANSVLFDDDVKITTDGKRVQITTDDLMMNCALLRDEYPDYERMLPTEFKAEVLVNVDTLVESLKSGSVVLSKDCAVMLTVGDGSIRVQNHSEQGDFEADIPCNTQGDGISVGFNERYLLSALNIINEEEAVIKLSGTVTPVIVQGKGKDGVHLLLPVRISA